LRDENPFIISLIESHSISLQICLELKGFFGCYDRVNILCSGNRIDWLLTDPRSCRSYDIHDGSSNCSLFPDSSSGIGDDKRVIRCRICAYFNHGNIQSFGNIIYISDTRTIMSRTDIPLQREKSYGSEDNKDGDDDDEFDESETMMFSRF